MADVEKFATVSSKGQLTLPLEFRKAMGIESGTRLRFLLQKGELRIRIAEQQDDEDPVIAQFLDLIGQDIAKSGALFDMPEDIAERMREAAKEEVDLDEEIEGDVAI